MITTITIHAHVDNASAIKVLTDVSEWFDNTAYVVDDIAITEHGNGRDAF